MKILCTFLLLILAGLTSQLSAQNTFIKDIYIEGRAGGEVLHEILDGFLIAGAVGSPENLLIAKFDLNGNYNLHKQYSRKKVTFPQSMKKLSGNNFLILSNTYDTSYVELSYSNWILKVNDMGDTIWTKELAGRLLDMDIAPDGGYIFTGYALLDPIGYPQRTAIYCVRTDSLATIIWQDTFEFDDYDKGLSIVANSDTTFTLLGHLVEHGTGKAPGTVIKLNDSGNLIWKRDYPYVTPYYGVNSIIRDGKNYIFSAENYTAVIEQGDAFVVKITGMGDTIWVKRFGENNLNGDHIFGLTATGNGNYAFTGFTSIDPFKPWLVQIDSSGNTLFDTIFNIGIYSGGHDIISTSDGGICITGSANMGNGVHNIVLIKTNAQGKITGIREYKPDQLIDIYPNPTTSSFILSLNLPKPAGIKLEMTDMLGRRVLSKDAGTQAAGSVQVQLETGHLPPGVYILKAIIGIETISRKVVVE